MNSQIKLFKMSLNDSLKPYQEQIIELNQLLNDLIKSNDKCSKNRINYEHHQIVLSILNKIEINLNHIKRIYNFDKILDETKFFETIKSFFTNNQDEQILNRMICILFELNLEFEENYEDNKLIKDSELLKNLIEFLKDQNINDNKFEIEKLLIIIQSQFKYIINCGLLTNCENFYENLILKLKELNLYKIDSQKILNFLLNSLIYLVKIEDNLKSIFNFCDLLEYLKKNIDFINCKNTNKLLSCLDMFMIAEPNCIDIFNAYDGFELLETIELGQTIFKIKSLKRKESICGPEDKSTSTPVDKNEKKDKTKKSKKWKVTTKELKKLNFKDNQYDCAKTFYELDLKEELIRAIYAYGFKEPSAIQQRAILPCIRGHNTIIKASLATGKSITSIISILQQIDNSLNECQALILLPSKESADKIKKIVIALGDYLKIDCCECVGGTPISQNIEKLKLGVHVVVGTVGRVTDMINRRVLVATTIRFLVLNNTSSILHRKFERNFHNLFGKLNKEDMQIILLCEKLNSNILKFSDEFIKDPILIQFENEVKLIEDVEEPIEDIREFENEVKLIEDVEEPIEDIREFYINCENEENKIDTLCNIFNTTFATIKQSIIFARKGKSLNYIQNQLKLKKLSCTNEDPSKKHLEIIRKEFRTGLNRFLITNSSLAFDNEVPILINYTMPSQAKYIYRTDNGKLNKKGITINLITKGEKKHLLNIEKCHKISIREMPANIMDLIKLDF